MERLLGFVWKVQDGAAFGPITVYALAICTTGVLLRQAYKDVKRLIFVLKVQPTDVHLVGYTSLNSKRVCHHVFCFSLLFFGVPL